MKYFLINDLFKKFIILNETKFTWVKTQDAVLHDKQGIIEIGFGQEHPAKLQIWPPSEMPVKAKGP